MSWKKEGSFTIEGTVIVSFICFMIGMVILMGFYGHDRMVLQETADELAMYGCLWKSRYVHPELGEVDYEAMLQNTSVSLDEIESRGYDMLHKRLFVGKVQSISVSTNLLGREINVEIQAEFKIGNYQITSNIHGVSVAAFSRDLPRRDSGEEKQEIESGELER